jgi:hypothetical protein
MPNKDGTGPVSGRGRGRGRRGGPRGADGTSSCVCPKCGHKEPHKRGTPCSEVKCPECGTPMKGKFCS